MVNEPGVWFMVHGSMIKQMVNYGCWLMVGAELPADCYGGKPGEQLSDG